MYDSFGDTIPCLNLGVPVIGLHHPRTEAINIFDLFWTKEAYKVYLEN
jgi:aspartyl aminopeptidase